MTKRLPPHGRRLLELRQRGLVPVSGQVAIAIDAWSYVHRDREGAIVLPAGEDPMSFDLRFVAGLPVLLVVDERRLTRADAVATLVMAAGSRGCAALITSRFCTRTGWKLYQSHFSELRDAA